MTVLSNLQRVMRMLAISHWSSTLAFLLLLAGCTGPGFRAPDIGDINSTLSIKPAWSYAAGSIDMPLTISVQNDSLGFARADGVVWVLDKQTGKELWRAKVSSLAAGIGSDGQTYAVISRENELIAIRNGKELWRTPMPSQSFTAPLVAGGRVFVLNADRSVRAFDGDTGRQIWSQSRPGEPLVLRQPGVLMSVGETLVAGIGGRLTGLQPLTGAIAWETTVGTSRGTNDMERLVDLVGPPSRSGESICVRAYQSSLGCVNGRNGSLGWTRRSIGDQGLSGDSRVLVGSESNGLVVAWSRATGEKVWSTERLRYRQLTAALFTPQMTFLGDSAGYLYGLSSLDGHLTARVFIDASGFATPPIGMGDGVLTVTRKGLVQYWQVSQNNL